MEFSYSQLSKAVALSYLNRDNVKKSAACACFHCLARFSPTEIQLWTDSVNPDDEDPGALRPDTDPYVGMTAICPRCEYDSVLGSECGYDLTDELLEQLHDHWHQSEPSKVKQFGGS